jgi:hypothetical protein
MAGDDRLALRHQSSPQPGDDRRSRRSDVPSPPRLSCRRGARRGAGRVDPDQVSVLRAAQAHGTNTPRRDRWPWRVRPRRRLPARSSWPGPVPAQEARRVSAPTRLLFDSSGCRKRDRLMYGRGGPRHTSHILFPSPGPPSYWIAGRDVTYFIWRGCDGDLHERFI